MITLNVIIGWHPRHNKSQTVVNQKLLKQRSEASCAALNVHKNPVHVLCGTDLTTPPSRGSVLASRRRTTAGKPHEHELVLKPKLLNQMSSIQTASVRENWKYQKEIWLLCYTNVIKPRLKVRCNVEANDQIVLQFTIAKNAVITTCLMSA